MLLISGCLCGRGFQAFFAAWSPSSAGRRSLSLGRASPRGLGRVQAFASKGSEEASDDLYAVLGLASDADLAAIKAAYRRESRASHPDLVRGTDEEVQAARDRFAQVGESFRVLSNVELRKAYDLRGLAGLAEFEFDGERVIMPPPWLVRIGHTGHHFWKREDYFVGLVAETVPDLSIEAIRRVYAEATKDPPGVGQAVLVERCTEQRAKDLVEALSEYGLICLAEEVEEEVEELVEPVPR